MKRLELIAILLLSPYHVHGNSDKPRIKNVIFDIGMVIFYNKHHGNYGAPHEKEEAHKIRRSPEFRNWYIGTYSTEELIDSLTPQFGRELTTRIVNRTCESRVFIPETKQIIKALKTKGYKLYVLSNTSPCMYERFVKPEPFFLQFNGMLFSFEAGSTKPEPEIYIMLLKKHQLIPEECVFIDDKEKNCIAARELGINAIQFKPGTLRGELGKMGVLK